MSELFIRKVILTEHGKQPGASHPLPLPPCPHLSFKLLFSKHFYFRTKENCSAAASPSFSKTINTTFEKQYFMTICSIQGCHVIC